MNKLSIGIIGITLMAIFTLTACEQKSKSEQVKEDLKETTETVSDIFRTEQEELRHDVEQALDRTDKKLAALQEDLASAADGTKEGINQEIEKWTERREELSKDLDHLGEDIGDGWGSFKQNVRQSLQQLEKELDSN